ncbi:MAG: S-layer homology domain-containing protein [Chloroflexota bacterium]|nr:S-layer homology domain-containing protein [Chloroflexota bacterium]
MRTKAPGQAGLRPLLLLLALVASLAGIGYAAISSSYAAAPLHSPNGKSVGAPQASPTAVTVGQGQTATWSGSTSGASSDPSTCVYGVNCDKINITVVNPGNSNNLTSRIQWASSTNDLDYYFCQGTDANPCATILATSATGSTNFEQVGVPNIPSGTNYYGVIVNFAGSTTYSGTVSLVQGSVPTSTPTGSPTPTGGRQPGDPGYQNYAAPNGLGTSAGEPSIGVNWKTGRVMFESNIQTLRVTFDITCSQAIWEDKSAPTSATSLDPILFTDSITGRTFVHQLTGNGGLSSYTDNDGDTYTPSDGGHLNESADHQTIGGGNYALGGPLPLPAQPYTHAVYYCAQGVAEAACARSDNGGLTYNPGIPIYSIATCGGLHGHVKVSPDGTVYVPNKGCGGLQGVAVSDSNDPVRQNGQGWVVRTVPGSHPGNTDPSVGLALDNTLYMGMQSNENGNTYAKIAVSQDRGLTWTTPFDVGAAFGIQNAVFPAVVAGDGPRAAFAFIGTSTPGDYQNKLTFRGVWHLYVAHTYDRGAHWTTVDATPNDPVQRGSICTGGTTCGSDRNLLDFFDITVDKFGRVLVGYADGCIGGCVNGTTNSFTDLATIARQSGGRRLFAQYDPVEPARPNAPIDVRAVKSNTTVRVTFTAPDTGGSAITLYRVYRGTTPANLQPIGTTTTTTYNDTPVDPATVYYYQVSAVNAQGEGERSCPVAAAAVIVQNPCLLPGAKVADDPAGDVVGGSANADIDLRELFVAEPYFGAGVNKLVFTLHLENLSTIPPNRTWAILWNSTDPAQPLRNFVRAKSNAGGSPSAVTYDYGRVEDTSNMPTPLGPADNGSLSQVSNTIAITISNSLVGNPSAGTSLGALDARTFAAQGDGTFTKTAAADSTGGTEYTLVGNNFCAPQGGPTATVVATGTPGASTRTSTPNVIPSFTPIVIASSTPVVIPSFTPTMTGTPPTATRTVTGTPPTSIPTSTSIVIPSFTPIVIASSTPTLTGTPPTATRTVTGTPPTQTSTSVPASTATVCPIQFTDVPTDNTFYSYVRCLACKHIVSGYPCGGTNPQTGEAEPCDANHNAYFRYNNPVSRGQISKLVSNSAGFNDDPGAQIYEDVPVGSPFYDFINRLSHRSVMGGYACGVQPDEPCIQPANRPYFRPSANASRGQLSKIVSNAAGFTEAHTEQTFEDVPTDNPFYVYIQRLASRDVMQGYPCGGTNPETGQAEPCGTQSRAYFRPANTVTRGQSSKIVANTFFPGCQTPLR